MKDVPEIRLVLPYTRDPRISRVRAAASGCDTCTRKVGKVTRIEQPHTGKTVYLCARCISAAYRATWGDDA